jgi:DNA-binding transcriptional MerR regulator
MNEKVTEKNNTLTIGELAEVSGTRLTTLKYYTELGILPFSQGGKRLTRKYTEGEALERLEKIKELKEKRLTIKRLTRKYTEGEALERLEKIKELKEKRLTIKEIITRFSKSTNK